MKYFLFSLVMTLAFVNSGFSLYEHNLKLSAAWFVAALGWLNLILANIQLDDERKKS